VLFPPPSFKHHPPRQCRCKFHPHTSLQINFLLFEAASGYSLFEIRDVDNIGLSSDSVQASLADIARFSKIASLVAFKPFTTAVDALEQINAVSESEMTEMLATFLTTSLPKVKDGKKAKFSLGVIEPKLASSVQEATRAMPRIPPLEYV
jgi:nucleolar protein 56